MSRPVRLLLSRAVPVLVPLLLCVCTRSRPPSVPVVSGPDEGVPGRPLTFFATATHPEGEDISCIFDWGDGTDPESTAYGESGEEVHRVHTYAAPGACTVRAQAKTEYGDMSEWSAGHAVVIGQAGSWSRAIGGSRSESAGSIRETSDGGYVLSGTSYTPEDGERAWFARTDAAGETLWTRTLGGDAKARTPAILQTADGGFILAGRILPPDSPASDAWLIKTNASGETLWSRTYGGENLDDVSAAEKTTDGGYILAGCTETYEAGWPTAWLVKTDGLGDTLWTWADTGIGWNIAWAVQQTSDGGYIGTGWYYTGHSDAGLVKLNGSGDTVWTKTFGGTLSDITVSVRQTADGGYVLAGHAESFGAGMKDAWLVKTDALGNELWSRTYGGAGRDYAHAVQQTMDGGYILAGSTQSFGAGGSDAWLIRTDGEGDTIWTRTFGGDGAEVGNAVLQTRDGGFILAGCTDSYGAAGADAWLIKVDANGE